MTDHAVISDDRPMSSVEIATRQKGPPSVTVKVYHADPSAAALEALKIYEEVATICRAKFSVQE